MTHSAGIEAGRVFETRALRNGIEIHLHRTAKFKSVVVEVLIHQPLRRETASLNALLPRVLGRGSESFPTAQAIARRLEELYGADLGLEVGKRGERQLISASMELTHERFLPGANGLLEEGARLLGGVLTRPVRVGRGFKPDYVEQEKELLRREIAALVNDKRSYAVWRTFEEMCRDEPFGVHRLGRDEDVAAITPEDLYAHYDSVLATAPIEVYAVGDVDIDHLAEVLSQAIGFPRRTPSPVPSTRVEVRPVEPRRVVERLAVNQARVGIGLRTLTDFNSPDFPALLVANGVLGGFSHSKLFQNVREKNSLAYDAYSQIDRSKGLMILFAGVDLGQVERATDTMLAQLDDLRAGRISEEEFGSTKRALQNQLRSSTDQPGSLIAFAVDARIHGRPERTIERLMEEVEQVDVDDVRRVAERLILDTTYVLTGSTD